MSRCKHCGARALPLRSVCDYCGSAFASAQVESRAPEAQARTSDEPPPRGRSEHLHERFQRLLNHPDLQRALAGGPSQPVPEERREGISKALGFFTVLAFFALTSGMFREFRYLLRGPAPIFLGLFVFLVVRRSSRNRSFPAAPLESEPARLMEVTEPWGREADPRPRALIELPGGSRRFLRLRRDLVGTLKPEDMGVAFIKADVLVDFQRIPI